MKATPINQLDIQRWLERCTDDYNQQCRDEGRAPLRGIEMRHYQLGMLESVVLSFLNEPKFARRYYLAQFRPPTPTPPPPGA